MTSNTGGNVILNKELLIGRGRDRACYRHPDDDDRCIKVSIVENDKQSRREPRYYKKLQNRNTNWDGIARYWGKISTNFGEGLVFDLVRDFDGAISKSITYYLDNQLIDQGYLPDILSELKTYLYTNKILARDISPNNLLFKKLSETSGKLVIIDGLGNAELIPVSTYIGFFTLRKIDKKWKGLIKRMKKDFPAYIFSSL